MIQLSPAVRRQFSWVPRPLKNAFWRSEAALAWSCVAVRPLRAWRTLLYRIGYRRVMGTEYPGVHLGSGGLIIDGFLNIDADWGIPCDVVGPVCRLRLADESTSVIYASHLFEHVRRRDIHRTLAEWRRVLRSGGGRLYLCVPDLEVLAQIYLDRVKKYEDPRSRHATDLAAGIMYGGQSDAYDFHYFGYSFTTLRELLLEVGFRDVERFDRSLLEFAPFRDGGYSHVDGIPISLNVVARK